MSKVECKGDYRIVVNLKVTLSTSQHRIHAEFTNFLGELLGRSIIWMWAPNKKTLYSIHFSSVLPKRLPRVCMLVDTKPQSSETNSWKTHKH